MLGSLSQGCERSEGITYMGVQCLPVTKLGEFKGKIFINASRLWVQPGHCSLKGS